MSIKYNELGEVVSVNGLTTGHHIGKPMQDAIAEKPEDNQAYATERNQKTRVKTSKDETQPSKQPDWNQNNPTAPDYVKNRPFYASVEDGLIEREFDGASALIDPDFVKLLYENRKTATYIVEGSEFVYQNDGVCDSDMWNYTIYSESLSLTRIVLANCSADSEIDTVQVMTMGGNRVPATIGIPGKVEVVHKIDPKYLPDMGGDKIIWLTYKNDGKLYHGFFSTETEVIYADIADLLSEFRAGTKIKVMYGLTEEPNSWGWYVADVISVYCAEDADGTFGGLAFFDITYYSDSGIVKYKLRG